MVGTLGQGDNVTRGTGPNEMGDNLEPVMLTFGGGQGAVTNAFAGTFHTCALGTEEDLACFGLNFVGQVGRWVYSDIERESGLIWSSIFTISSSIRYYIEFDSISSSIDTILSSIRCRLRYRLQFDIELDRCNIDFDSIWS